MITRGKSTTRPVAVPVKSLDEPRFHWALIPMDEEVGFISYSIRVKVGVP